MKLQDLEFGIGFGNEIVLGEVFNKKGRIGRFKDTPLIVTKDVLDILLLYMKENKNKSLKVTYESGNDKNLELNISVNVAKKG